MSNHPDEQRLTGNGRGGNVPPTDADSDRDPVEELAQEFAERQRQGESPSIEEYAQKYPQLADEIRDLFPTIAAIEQLTERKQRRQVLSEMDPLASLERIGDFRVVGEIGRGGMGIVLEAEQVTLGRRVAVKVLPQHSLRSPKELQRFYREAQTAAKLHHTNIVPVFGVGEQDGIHYIVMQLIQGVGLDRVLSELRHLVLGASEETDSQLATDGRSTHARRNAAALLREELRPLSAVHSTSPTSSGWSPSETSPLDSSVREGPAPVVASSDDHQAAGSGMASQLVLRPLGVQATVELIGAEYWRNVARIGVQVCSALQYAHGQGTLHRDIKPANLLLDNAGVVWVADFGLAKAVEQGSVTWTGDIVGTLSYMAPERFEGHADARSDIYSLGLTLYELATLQRAHGGRDRAALIRQVTTAPLTPPRKHNPAIPRDLETIILKAAAREPGDRYESAEALAADLQCFLEDRPIRARRAAPAERFVRWCRRNRMVASLAAAVVMLLMLVSAAVAVGYVREARERLRAEQNAELAISYLDRIYAQFAPSPLRLSQPTTPDQSGETIILEDHTHLPLSNEVAVLLESLLQFYDRLAEQTNDDQRVLLRFITANGKMGAIHHRLGELDRAQQAYQRAIETAGRIGDQFGDQAALQMELARLYNGLGMVMMDRHSHGQAYEAHQKAQSLLETLPHARGEDAETRYELAHTLYLTQLADRAREWDRQWQRQGRRRDRDRRLVQDQGRRGDRQEDRDRNDQDEPLRPEPGERPIDRAAQLLVALTDEHPENPDYQFLLARCYLASGDGRRGGEDCDPEECDQKAIAILENLVERYPDFPDYRYELGVTYARREFWRLFPRWRHHREDAESLAKAANRVRKALDTTRDLELNHPNIPQYLEFKSRLHRTMGMICREQDNLQEAELNFRDAAERLRLVVARVQDKRRPQTELARTRIDLADVRRELGRLDEAEEMLTAQVDELQQLMTQFPEQDREWWFARDCLSKTYLTLESVLRDMGQPERADQMAQREKEI